MMATTATPQQAHVLDPGTLAPDFALQSAPDRAVSLHDFRGRPVVLAFYSADFNPVCSDQLALYNEMLGDFDEHGAQLLGISVDGVWCHKAFSEARKLRFPLLSDFEPKGIVAQRFGAYDHTVGTCERALFVLDAQGVIRWSHLSPPDVNPGADGILVALEKLVEPISRHGVHRTADRGLEARP